MHLQEIIQNVNFSKVGSTNLKPMDIKDAIVKEKLSFLLLSELKKIEFPQDLYYSRISRFYEPKEVKSGVIDGKKNYELVLSNPYCLDFYEIDSDPAAHGNIYFVEKQSFQSIRAGASFEEISLFDATRKEERIPDSDRIEELLLKFKIADDDIYTKFKIDRTFKPQIFPKRIPKPQENTNVDGKIFASLQRNLAKWFKGGFPRRYALYGWNGAYLTKKEMELPDPIFYKPLGYMTYDVQHHNKFEPMRLQRLFFNPDGCGLCETLIPTIFIRERFVQYPVMTGLPNTEQVPLWNARRIMKETTDTVVICGCIQDAEALQRYNATMNENVIFTSFVDVGEKLDLIDFSPLNGKNVVFLISNHNGISLADAYFEADKVYRYFCEKTKIRGKKKLVIPEFAFIQRKVEYPDSSSTIATPEELASAYYHTPPKIVPESTYPKFPLMGESAFVAKVARIRESPWDSSLFVNTPKETRKKNASEEDDTFIRTLLYHGEITLLAGSEGSGKTRFCQTLIRYIVNGDDQEFLKERFWTRCYKNNPIKILYWSYDGIGEKALRKWEKTCKKGLTKKQKDNIFIEDSPLWTEEGFHTENGGRPYFDLYKRKLAEYTLMGEQDHPLDLLIVDNLSNVWNEEKLERSLRFLQMLAKKAVPGMAVLVIHHTSDLNNILGGVKARKLPRVILTLQKADKSIIPNLYLPESAKFFQIHFCKINKAHLDIEELPFYCVRENIDKYSVVEPICTRDEMFEALRYYYKSEDGGSLSNKEIGNILGETSKKKIIDKNTYETILRDAKAKLMALDALKKATRPALKKTNGNEI